MEQIDKIISVIAETFEIEGADLNAESSIYNLDEWDSISHLSLILALEEAFEISFSMEEIELCKSVKGIEEVIKSSM